LYFLLLELGLQLPWRSFCALWCSCCDT